MTYWNARRALVSVNLGLWLWFVVDVVRHLEPNAGTYRPDWEQAGPGHFIGRYVLMPPEGYLGYNSFQIVSMINRFAFVGVGSVVKVFYRGGWDARVGFVSIGFWVWAITFLLSTAQWWAVGLLLQKLITFCAKIASPK